MDDGLKKFLFEWIGAASAFSLLLVAFYLIPGALRGDFRLAADFFRQYPGIEPFVIFITPITLAAGPLWVYTKVRAWKNSRQKTPRN